MTGIPTDKMNSVPFNFYQRNELLVFLRKEGIANPLKQHQQSPLSFLVRKISEPQDTESCSRRKQCGSQLQEGGGHTTTRHGSLADTLSSWNVCSRGDEEFAKAHQTSDHNPLLMTHLGTNWFNQTFKKCIFNHNKEWKKLIALGIFSSLPPSGLNKKKEMWNEKAYRYSQKDWGGDRQHRIHHQYKVFCQGTVFNLPCYHFHTSTWKQTRSRSASN